jgi:23S rRNA (adenine2503-C2)-methyltransferase
VSFSNPVLKQIAKQTQHHLLKISNSSLYKSTIALWQHAQNLYPHVPDHFELKLIEHHISLDESVKCIFAIQPANKHMKPLQIEAVYMPEKTRTTICVSSQVGCAQGCKFCATGRMGLLANLTAKQIVEQYIHLQQLSVKLGFTHHKPISNIVFMGMGEPLDNWDAVETAAHVFHENFSFAARKITISTIGIVKHLPSLLESPFSVALSIHQADTTKRSFLMPANKANPLTDIMSCIRQFVGPGRKRPFMFFQYIMIHDITDSPTDAENLVVLLEGIPAKVNLIAYNSQSFISWSKSPDQNIKNMQKALTCAKIKNMLRISKGQDILGGCGQLIRKRKIINTGHTYANNN